MRITRTARALLAAAVLLPALVLGAAPAWAHAGLVDSDPADGARLDAAPRSVTLSFNEDIQQPAYVVVRAGGREVAQGEAQVDGPRVTQSVPPDAPGGRWSVAFRVVSTDGHPVTGEVDFAVDAAPQEGPSASPTSAAGADDADDTDDAAVASPATTAESEAGGQGLWQRHGDHVLVGAALIALAGVVLVVARRAR